MGAAWAGAYAADMPNEVESAILFAPAGELVPQALSRLRKGGTLAIAGIHLSDIPALNYEQSLYYERNLCSVTANTREDGGGLLAEAARIPVRPHVATYPLRDANRALMDLKDDRINGTGVLVVDD
jgi:propanol-preferring alcohol dehydrogenase